MTGKLLTRRLSIVVYYIKMYNNTGKPDALCFSLCLDLS